MSEFSNYKDWNTEIHWLFNSHGIQEVSVKFTTRLGILLRYIMRGNKYELSFPDYV